MLGTAISLTAVLNGLAVAALLVGIVAAVLVTRDARRQGLSGIRALGRAIVTLVLLPIGAGLSRLLGRSPKDRHGP